jgi:hypothetical protein
MSKRLPEIQIHLDRIEAEAEAALQKLVQADPSRAVRRILEKGILAGKLESIIAIARSAKDTLDE